MELPRNGGHFEALVSNEEVSPWQEADGGTRLSSRRGWWSWSGRGGSPDRLAKEFEPSATAIRRWVEQADRDEGLRKDGLTTAERKEVRELKRELRQVKLERDILAKATAWFARESGSILRGGSGS